MFLKKRNKSLPTTGTTLAMKQKDVCFSFLGSQTFFEGKALLKGEVRVAGRMKGTIISEDFLIIEETAEIKGELQGVVVEVSGVVEGKLVVSDTLRLTSSARVDGEICTCKLIVEEGAKLYGKVSYLESLPVESSEGTNMIAPVLCEVL